MHKPATPKHLLGNAEGCCEIQSVTMRSCASEYALVHYCTAGTKSEPAARASVASWAKFQTTAHRQSRTQSTADKIDTVVRLWICSVAGLYGVGKWDVQWWRFVAALVVRASAAYSVQKGCQRREQLKSVAPAFQNLNGRQCTDRLYFLGRRAWKAKMERTDGRVTGPKRMDDL